MENVLSVNNLHTTFLTHMGKVYAVRGVSFALGKGESLGIVGESGSGKSVTSLTILKALSGNSVVEGEILFGGVDLLKASGSEMRNIRGAKISMIFQDPMTSLNPLMTIGRQVSEAILRHTPMQKAEARDYALKLLERVKIPDAARRFNAYPHELSGGMRQRIMTAIALSCKPDVVIADEPTTALDVTIQNQILELLKEMQREMHMSVLFITHDLGVVAEFCERVVVMYGGLILEEALIDELFYQASHPYTLGLIASIPKITQDKSVRLKPIGGSPPDMYAPPPGCPFYPRCAYARNICVAERPPYFKISPSHKSMCWMLDEDAPSADNPFKGGGA